MGFLSELCFEVVNLGLVTGLTLGALLLLRPILKRILSPQQRVVLWAVGWLPAYWKFLYILINGVHLLPVTFRDLITPRMEYGFGGAVPAYLPDLAGGAGRYHVVLPGGMVFEVDFQPEWVWPIVLVWCAGVVAVVIYASVREQQLIKLLGQGVAVSEDEEWLQKFPELKEYSVQVRLYEHLPTSFVCKRRPKGAPWGTKAVICLEKGLPLERQVLILRHELNHLRLWHCGLKWYSTLALTIHWWNPLVWLGNKYFCRDLELACDRATLEQLESHQHKEYAKTLVDVASGRQMWSEPLCFGECDAQVRVREIVHWKDSPSWKRLCSIAVVTLLLLFFLGGPNNRVLAEDVLLNWEKQEGTAQTLVTAMEEKLLQAQMLPEGVSIREVWMESHPGDGVFAAGSGKVYLYGRLTNGGWLRLGGRLYAHGHERMLLEYCESPYDQPPDLKSAERLV